MSTIQLALFDLIDMMEKQTVSVDAYYSEFHSLAAHQRNNAGYGGDLRAEKTVKDLIRQGDISYKQWKGKDISDEACTNALYELIVHLWCVKVNGKTIMSDICKVTESKTKAVRLSLRGLRYISSGVSKGKDDVRIVKQHGGRFVLLNYFNIRSDLTVSWKDNLREL